MKRLAIQSMLLLIMLSHYLPAAGNELTEGERPVFIRPFRALSRASRASMLENIGNTYFELPESLSEETVGVSVQDLINQGKILAVTRGQSYLLRLDLSGKNINSLEGLNNISGIANIQSLNLSFNKITDINPNAFAGFKKLKIIDLSNNQIVTLHQNAFAGLSILNVLDLNNNNIAHINHEAFTDLSYLNELNLSDNHIVEFASGALAGLAHLRKLLLDNNPVSEEKLQPLEIRRAKEAAEIITKNILAYGIYGPIEISLRSPILGGRRDVELFDIASLFQSREALASPERLAKLKSSFEFPELVKNIEILNGSLKIKAFQASDLDGIARAYYLYYKGLRPLPAWLEERFTGVSVQDLINNDMLPRVEQNALGQFYMNLSNKYIGSLDGIRNMYDIQTVIMLNLSGNRITSINTNTFSELFYLKHLSLSKNNIRDIQQGAFIGLSSLQQLFLNDNEISALDAGVFAGLARLNELSLANNPLSEGALIDIEDGVHKVAPEASVRYEESMTSSEAATSGI